MTKTTIHFNFIHLLILYFYEAQETAPRRIQVPPLVNDWLAVNEVPSLYAEPLRSYNTLHALMGKLINDEMLSKAAHPREITERGKRALALFCTEEWSDWPIEWSLNDRDTKYAPDWARASIAARRR